MEQNTLISIIVLSYNSANTILDTLNSIDSQTYKNWECIIADDCSKDKTIQMCLSWICKHNYSNRFTLLDSENNMGLCSNLNRAIKKAKGEWIKIIAGDDILLDNCLYDYVLYTKSNPNTFICTSYMHVYKEHFTQESLIQNDRVFHDKTVFNKAASEQLKVMSHILFVYAPTVFIKRDLYDKIGLYDETYSFEDYPFYINALEHGINIHLLEKATVGYRIHDSLCNSTDKLFNYKFSLEVRRFKKERCFRYCNCIQKLCFRLQWMLDDFMMLVGANKVDTPLKYCYSKAQRMLEILINMS